MSPIAYVTLNTIELTRTKFLSQEIRESIPRDSEKFGSFLFICGKNAEKSAKYIAITCRISRDNIVEFGGKQIGTVSYHFEKGCTKQ